jgi:hypothetical protein
MARKRKEVEQEAAAAVEAVEELAAPEEAQLVEAEVLPGSVEEQEGAPVALPAKWVVVEDCRVSLFGQITTLPAGTIVSLASYGHEGVRRMLEQGVFLEPAI